jgi:hypothetical protein
VCVASSIRREVFFTTILVDLIHGNGGKPLLVCVQIFLVFRKDKDFLLVAPSLLEIASRNHGSRLNGNDCPVLEPNPGREGARIIIRVAVRRLRFKPTCLAVLEFRPEIGSGTGVGASEYQYKNAQKECSKVAETGARFIGW